MQRACMCTYHKCHTKIKEDDRKAIFDYFWKLCNKKERISFLINRVTIGNVQRKTVKGDSRRTCTYLYSFIVNNKIIAVCKTMFMNTLAITEKYIRYWVEKVNLKRKVIIKKAISTRRRQVEIVGM